MNQNGRVHSPGCALVNVHFTEIRFIEFKRVMKLKKRGNAREKLKAGTPRFIIQDMW
ncbi:MAG: hypothetical protein K9N06_04970 [Candidatus Cloacimonetes bacterium]|nr:hypothetical protein [Candidatus Cloacimonadota bacterium]